MWPQLKNQLVPKLPVVVLGLFVGRLLSEQWAVAYGSSLWATLLITLAATLYPSWKASRVRPAEALSYE